MTAGVFLAGLAGLMWGLVFITPVLLSDYPAALLSAGRYVAFGLIALPLAWADRRHLAELSPHDWIEALKLSVVGNLLYYLFLAAAIQRSGAPVPTMIIGTLPVVIALTAYAFERRDSEPELSARPWRRLGPSLGLMAAGLLLVNHTEVARWQAADTHTVWRHTQGIVLALCAVACWTWYPLRNAAWLKAHPHRSARAWATAQGLATLPLALIAYGGLWVGFMRHDPAWQTPWGPHPQRFVILMLVVGLLASWVGTLCWNEASRRLRPSVLGQLIVFETLAALAYAWVLRQQWPDPLTWAAAGLLVLGVVLAVRAR